MGLLIRNPLSNTKIIHNAIFTKYKLSLMGKFNGKCHLCKIETEYLTHLFYNCIVVKNVPNDIETRINNSFQRKGYIQLSIDLQMVIIGADEKEKSMRVFINSFRNF